MVPVDGSKDLHRLQACLEQTPSESHLQNSTRHTTLLWGQTDFLTMIDMLMGTEPLFCGVRVAVIDPFSSHATILLINVRTIGLLIS